MTTYTGLKQSFTPGIPPGGDSAQYVFGLSFKVTSSGKQLDGWWWYCDITNGQDNHADDFALWQVTGAGTGTYVASSKVTSGVFSQGWNFVSCATPIALTSGQEYRAVKTINKANASATNYCHTANFFDTGSASAGAVNGPLTVFAAPGAGTNPEPAGDGQQTFTASNPATDVTANYPTSQFNESWYGLDVQVSSVTVSGTGSVRMHKMGLAGTAVETDFSTGSVRMHKMGLAASGIVKDTATGSVRMHKMGLAASGFAYVPGGGSVAMHKMGLHGSGTETDTGTGSVRMHKMGISAIGLAKIPGTGSVRMHKMGLAGSAVEADFGTGSVRMHKMGLVGSGTVTNPFGSGSVRMHKMGISASGTETDKGIGSVRMHKMILVGVGTEVGNVGSIAMHKMGLSGSGRETTFGSGSVRMHKMAIHISAVGKDVGSGSVQMHKMGVRATNIRGKATPLFVFTAV